MSILPIRVLSVVGSASATRQHRPRLAAFSRITFPNDEIEQRLAADFFSPELLSALRQAHLFGAWESTPSAPHYKRAWQHIFAIELFMPRENECPVPSCIEVVNALRNAPDGVFEEWKQSKTALLFETFLKIMDFRTKNAVLGTGSEKK